MSTDKKSPNQMSDDDIKSAFDTQLHYTLTRSPEDGSVAIALGRTAGLAKQLDMDKIADLFWQRLQQLPSEKPNDIKYLPSLDQCFAAYRQHPQTFERFVSGEGREFTLPGTDFSNAMGAYAFAVDYVRRGKDAIVNGGEPFRIFDAAAGAMWSASGEKDPNTGTFLEKPSKGTINPAFANQEFAEPFRKMATYSDITARQLQGGARPSL